MAHCPYEKLSDLTKLFEGLEKLERLKQKSPGIYYLKSKGFLHFHEKQGRRWVDVRDGRDWGEEIDVPSNPSQRKIGQILKEIKRRYENTLQAL